MQLSFIQEKQILKTHFRTITVILILLTLASCSTRRDKWLNRNWHGMNTRYNGYYNGRLAIQEAFLELSKAHKDDFNRPIPVYRHGNKDIAQAVNPHTDRALEKGAKMIKKHSMLINGSQKNKWIDDCYFLLGQANFIKRESYPAIQQFRYVIQSSEDPRMKQLARIWMILAYNDLKEFSQAESEFNHFADQKLSPKNELAYQAAMADFFIKSEEYLPAIIPLSKLAKDAKKKKERARYNFIIGQIWQEMGNAEEANKYFTRAIKLKPEYELEFQAAIAVAISSGEGSDNSDLKKTLRKMLRDDKNIDYRDQIYYAMAIVSLKENNEKLALEQFTKSVKASTKNPTQKGISYLAMADIFYKKPDFIRAQRYFDSSRVHLDKKHPAFERTELLAENLKDIVLYSTQIEDCDSLLTLISMTPEQQKAKMQGYVEYLIKSDQEEKIRREQAALAALNTNTNPNLLENNGKWYFFNSQTVAFGKEEFKKLWGSRKNEDNWRRKNKTSTGGDFEIVEVVESSDPENPTVRDDENPRYDPNTYLALIPTGTGAVDSLTTLIYDSYFRLGLVYKDRLHTYPQAIDAFNALLKRNKENKYVPELYYQLYVAHKLNKQESEANRQKDILLQQYASSDYAKMILDPTYLAKKDKKDDAAEKAYVLAYNYYSARDYSSALRETETAFVQYANSEVLPKFSLLKAMLAGVNQGKEAYISALNETMKSYPSTDEGKKAQDILRILETLKANENAESEEVQNFKNPGEKEKHYYIISIPEQQIDVNESKLELSRFNQQYYRNSSLQIQEIVFGAEHKFLIVKEFPNGNSAITYYKSVGNNSEIVESIPSEQIPVAFVISVSNYITLMKSQSLPEYVKFFFDTYRFN